MMAVETNGESEQIPGTVFTPRQVRLLKIAVIVMGLALVGGFALVIGAIVYQASELGKTSVPSADTGVLLPAPAQQTIKLKPGQSISRIALDGSRLAVHVTGGGADEIRVIDLATGKIIARVQVTSE